MGRMDRMRRLRNVLLTVAIALCLPAAASVEVVRSSRHLIQIERQPGAGVTRHFSIIVFNASSRSEIARMQAVTNGSAVGEAEMTHGGVHFDARFVPFDDSHLVEVTIDDGETAEVIRANFTGSKRDSGRSDRANARRAGRDIPEPAVLHRIDAVCPETARAAGASGAVIVEVLLDRSGFVIEANVTKAMGHGLDEAAIEAVRQWQFATSMLNRAPVPVLHEVTFDFLP